MPITTPAPSFDPAAMLLQAGAFGMACYLVYFITHDLTQVQQQICLTLQANTLILQKINDTLNNLRDPTTGQKHD